MLKWLRKVPTIDSIEARQILDSRGNPTVEVEMCSGKFIAREQVPSGASTGENEARELRDGGTRFHGRGVSTAVKNVDVFARSVTGLHLGDLNFFDRKLIEIDPTKAKLGANAMLGLSLAYARLSAQVECMSLAEWLARMSQRNMCMPVPFMNIINGGKHAGNSISFQEHMIVPRAQTVAECLRIGAEVYHELKILLEKKFGKSATNVGDEGGFAPNLKGVDEPFLLMSKAVSNMGYAGKVAFAIDAAASSFYDNRRKKYVVGGKLVTRRQLLALYQQLARTYPLISIEDPFEEHDGAGYAELRSLLGKKVQIVGDDLTVSQPVLVTKAIEQEQIDCLLLKVNQVGTVSEALEAARIAFAGGKNVMVSHRSGETESTFIADLAVGLGCGQIKAGAPCRGERTAKYNQLLRLENEYPDLRICSGN